MTQLPEEKDAASSFLMAGESGLGVADLRPDRPPSTPRWTGYSLRNRPSPWPSPEKGRAGERIGRPAWDHTHRHTILGFLSRQVCTNGPPPSVL